MSRTLIVIAINVPEVVQKSKQDSRGQETFSKFFFNSNAFHLIKFFNFFFGFQFTESPNWHHAGKDKLLVCKNCRLYYKKYGRMPPLVERREPPSFIFKAAFENLREDELLSNSGRMRTRRSATPVVGSGGSVRNRILQEIHEGKFQGYKSTHYY